MKTSDLFPSKYLKAADLKDGPQTASIHRLVIEEIGPDKESRGVLYFHDFEKGLVLNKTNCLEIEALYGDSDDWEGNPVELYSTKVPFGGKVVDAVRVRAAKGQRFVDEFVNGSELAQPKTKAAKRPEDKADAVDPELNDDIPY